MSRNLQTVLVVMCVLVLCWADPAMAAKKKNSRRGKNRGKNNRSKVTVLTNPKDGQKKKPTTGMASVVRGIQDMFRQKVNTARNQMSRQIQDKTGRVVGGAKNQNSKSQWSSKGKNEPYRKYEINSNGYSETVDAKLVSVDGNSVKLQRKSDGLMGTFQLSMLSQKDKQYVQSKTKSTNGNKNNKAGNNGKKNNQKKKK